MAIWRRIYKGKNYLISFAVGVNININDNYPAPFRLLQHR